MDDKPPVSSFSPHHLSFHLIFISFSTWVNHLVLNCPLELFPLTVNSDALLDILVLSILFMWADYCNCFSYNYEHIFNSSLFCKILFLIPSLIRTLNALNTDKKFHNYFLNFASIALCKGPCFGTVC
jgi:MFS superfamily sulfate permease-like transporter